VKKNRTVEILAPAGDEERMRMAVAYGADAVYLAGTRYGMRAAAGNFDRDALDKAVRYCHERGRKVYVTCNTLPREDELRDLPDYLNFLQDIGTDAVIAADFGVLSLIRRETPRLKIHVSTQLGVVNSETARALYEYGADTVVLARELSL
jgi:putative protease